ncbi:MAG: hypothetical protein KDD62_11150 [Bdellovibrionales bacterium]|nr:hypothetical protein [Bdellovibrionales bacterium]
MVISRKKSYAPSHMKNSKLLIFLGAIVLLSIGYGLGARSTGQQAPLKPLAQMLVAKPPYVKPAQAVRYEKPEPMKFLRVSRDPNHKIVSVDTATVRYEPIDGSDLKVDLIGAVHMADREYFANLNQAFQQYERVLYELVAPPDTRPTKDRVPGTDPFSVLQASLPEMLAFSHQLDEVDYHAPNLVHADLSFEDLREEARKRGETAFTLIAGMALDFLKVVQKMEEQQDQLKDVSVPGLLEMLTDPNAFRQSFAETLALMDDEESIGGFTTLTPYIIEARNNAALAVLDQEIQAGRKKLAIFYGAAHLSDFEGKLLSEFGLKRTGVQWNKAWDLRKDVPTRSPFQQLGSIFRLFQNADSPQRPTE